MYSTIIPRLQALRKQHGLEQLISFPKCFYASLAKGIIVLEDLKRQNYEMLNKANDRGMGLKSYIDFNYSKYNYRSIFGGIKAGFKRVGSITRHVILFH